MTTGKHVCLIMQGGPGWMGGAEYIRNLAMVLSRNNELLRITILGSKALSVPFYEPIRKAGVIRFIEDFLDPETLSNRIRWKLQKITSNGGNPRIDNFLRSEKVDFVYPYYYKPPRNATFRSASWIYDFQHKYMPELFAKEEVAKREKFMAHLARHSEKVVLSSQTAFDDFKATYPKSVQKVLVMHFHTVVQDSWFEGDPVAIQKKYHLPEKFFILSNQFWKHKNHLLVFKAIKLCKEKQIEIFVVCTGHIYDNRQPHYCDHILEEISEQGIMDNVRLLGMIPKNDQVQLMRRSIAVIQPSLFEGWNTVVEEGRGLGKTMVLSDIAVHAEQDPQYSKYFKKDSPEALAKIMTDWWNMLMPGPDTEREKKAQKNNEQLMQKFGSRFLEIAGYTQEETFESGSLKLCV